MVTDAGCATLGRNGLLSMAAPGAPPRASAQGAGSSKRLTSCLCLKSVHATCMGKALSKSSTASMNVEAPPPPAAPAPGGTASSKHTAASHTFSANTSNGAALLPGKVLQGNVSTRGSWSASIAVETVELTSAHGVVLRSLPSSAATRLNPSEAKSVGGVLRPSVSSIWTVQMLSSERCADATAS